MAARIHAHIARHFWRNKENAVWQSSEFFPSGLLTWLKANYSELVSGSRPSRIVRPEGAVYLFFNDEREIHGRMATRLTACWIHEQVIDDNDVYIQLQRIDGLSHSDTLIYTIKAKIVKQQRPFIKMILVMVILLLVVIGFYWWLNPKPGAENNILTQDAYQTLQRLPVVKTVDVQQQEHAAVNQLSVSDSSVNNSKSDICQLIHGKDYCFQYFVSERCNHISTLNYSNWLKELKQKKQTAFTNRACPEKFKTIHDDPDIRQYLSNNEALKIQSNKLEQLFFNTEGEM